VKLPLLLCFGLALGCTVTEPGARQGDVELRVMVPRDRLAAGDTASLQFEITNLGSSRIGFTFGTACHLEIRIADRRTGQLLSDQNGGWFCAAYLSGMTLEPAGRRSVSVLLHGVSPMPANLQGLHLDAGSYEVGARFRSLGYRLQTGPLRFEVR
jgi:hypothetical protein